VTSLKEELSHEVELSTVKQQILKNFINVFKVKVI
jgi:hypothetical protein